MHPSLISSDALMVQDKLVPPEHGLIICDEKLIHYFPKFFTSCNAPIYTIEASETRKNLSTVHDIYRFFARHSLKRTDEVHIFGGGTVCDMAAFAVSTYKRGCGLILYPSTLLAMIDASIGGKTAVNFEHYKNHIGTFYPAFRIVYHASFLESLAKDELRQGFAEMLKAHILYPDLCLPDISGNSLPSIEEILSFALYKISICQNDPYDEAERRILNFGHSFAHALESISEYRIKHGDAVALGMNIACDLSLELQLCSQNEWSALKNILALYPYPDEVLAYAQNYSIESLIPYLKQDKKNRQALGLILPVGKDIKEIELSLDYLK
ncbi:MAG: 3-dehydroquinate synthase [Candidatus Cloacimonetes bacterium]|nr:3-dehydroquinate synthase [Candidatus Cloacimonadota bacterium]